MDKKIKTLVLLLIFVVIILGASIGYNTLKSKNSVSNNKENAKVDTNEKSKIKAQDFDVIDKDGKSVKLSDYLGKPIVINFFASWCPPCKAELPDFNKVYLEMKDNVTFLMVDLTDGQRETVDKAKKFIGESNYEFPVLFDTKSDAAIKYNITSIPKTVFIDKDGEIVKEYNEMIDEKILRSSIESIK